MSGVMSPEHFLCSICLDVFTAPVTLMCGHSFCKNCITENWRITRRCQCPVCKKHLGTSQELNVNIFMSEMVAQFRESAAEEETVENVKAGEVPCDVCSGIRLRAVRSCLVCMASYCDAHLERHRTVSGLKRHQLIPPVNDLEARICTKHDDLLELFCRTDLTFVCKLCSETEHKSHCIVSLNKQREEKQAELEQTEAEVEQMIQERELKMQELREAEKLLKEAAEKEAADGVEVFTAMARFVDSGLSALSAQIQEKHSASAAQAEGFIQELDEEISALKKINGSLRQLSCSDDHFHFLQRVSSLQDSLPTKDWTEVRIPQPSYEGTTARAVAQLQETLGQWMKKELEADLRRVQQFAVDMSLDPDTAHPKLLLSDDGKQVNHRDVEHNLPDNPERFSFCVVVLAKQSFSSGRFYYEVEVKGKTKWDLGVVSARANRKGAIVSSPEAGYWTLQLRNGCEYVALADPDVLLPVNSSPQKVGVFVDYEQGLVSFYDADAADLLYSFTTCSFTDKLYPFFSPCFNDDGQNSAPLRISMVHWTD